MKGWLIELHCHSSERSFDGKVSAAKTIEILLEKKFHGVVFTDHNNVWPNEELASLRRETGAPDEFVILSGQEIRLHRNRMALGDVLVYGLEESLSDQIAPEELFQRLRESGGFAIAPHVGAPYAGLERRAGDFPMVAAEVWNARYGAKVAALSRKVAADFNLAEIGGSDSHEAEGVGTGGTLFAEPVRTLDDIGRILRDGDVRVWRPGLISRLIG